MSLSLPSSFKRLSKAFWKASKAKTPLRLQDFVGQLLLLFVEISRVGFPFFGHAVNEPVLPRLKGAAASPALRLKAALTCLALAAPGMEPSRAMRSLVFGSKPRERAATSNFSPALTR